MESGESNQENASVDPVELRTLLGSVDPAIRKLSRGFLRCRPEKWFPGFRARWITLMHSLGLEAEIREVRPMLSGPDSGGPAFCGIVDGEPVVFEADETAAEYLQEAVIPGADHIAGGIVLEYLSRRFLSSLGDTWSGPGKSIVQFDAERDARNISVSGAIQLQLSLNREPCVIWIKLGKQLVDRLDSLWRKQICAVKSEEEQTARVGLEIAQLAVEPAMIGDYTQSGTVIDLEVPISDTILLRRGGHPWLAAKLCTAGETLAFEIQHGTVPAKALPAGTSRVSVQLGRLDLDPTEMAEIAQPGAIYQTDIPISNAVQMRVDGQKITDGILCSYQGRFAINVT